MRVFTVDNNYLDLITIGKEKKYYGTHIDFEEKTNVFLIYRFPSYTKMFIVNDTRQEMPLFQVSENILIECVYDLNDCKRMLYFINEKKAVDDFIFYINPAFFKQCYSFIKLRNYKVKMNYLYERYRRRNWTI